MRNIYILGGGAALIVALVLVALWAPWRGAPATVPAAASGKVAPAPADAVVVVVGPDDRFLGRADAPVTIIEYSSMTCPHCARFHAEVLPRLQEEFIDPGKLRLVFREFPLDRAALAAAVLARCAAPEQFFGFIEMLFRGQAGWAAGPDVRVTLARVARLGGIGQARFDACMEDQALIDAIVKRRLEGAQKFGVNSTPSFIIDGRNQGNPSLEQFRQILAGLLSNP